MVKFVSTIDIFDCIHAGTVGNFHAFRTTGRSRSKDDICQAIGGNIMRVLSLLIFLTRFQLLYSIRCEHYGKRRRGFPNCLATSLWRLVINWYVCRTYS